MDGPNVLFIVMDTARAQNALPSTSPKTVPRLAELANDGVEYTSAISTAPWTLPSHASMFTGQYTSDHGTNAGNKQFDPDHDPLPKLLQDAGYNTVAFSNNSWVSPEFGFDSGFDEFYAGWTLFDDGGNLTRVMREYNDPRAQLRELFASTGFRGVPMAIANAAYTKFLRKLYDYGAFVTNWKIQRWLDERPDGDPFFMFVNYLEPHVEYDPPRGYCTHLPDDVSVAEAKQIEQDVWGYISGNVELSDRDFEILEGLYDSEIGYLDHRIGKLLDDLSSRGVLKDTLVVIVGDHGENIGEHGLMDHQYSLNDTVVHVPLIVRGPEEFRGGRQISEVVETRALFPTFLEAADVDVPVDKTVASRSLSVSLDGGGPDGDDSMALSEYLVPQPAVDTLRERVGGTVDSRIEKYDRALRAARTGRWKLIEFSDGTRNLYDITADPGETTDRSTDYPDIADQLQQRLLDKLGPLTRDARNTGTDTLDSGTQQRLEDLGYI